jgi:hypothetical protein
MQKTSLRLDPAKAKCATEELNPDMFFADDPSYDNYSKALTAGAKKVCLSCELQKECYEFALDNKLDGVWGGTTTSERNTMLNRISRTGSVEDRRRLNKPTNLNERNTESALRAGLAIAEDLAKAIELDNGRAKPETIMMARLKVENPGMSYGDMALQIGFSKATIQNRLQRFARRNK